VNWQPIDSAPKDGRSVLAYAGEVVVMRYIADRDCNLWVYTDELLSDACPEPDQPTHWVPLPAPPEAA
jgi:hypothetical protein